MILRFPLLLRMAAACCCAAVGSAFAAAPVITNIPTQTVPCGKSLVVPVQVNGNGPMTFSVSGSNAKVIPVLKTGNPFLKIHVDYAGNGGSSPAFSGDMIFELFRDLTPKTTGFISGFAQAGFYDGLKFFRVTPLIPGDPTSTIAQAGSPSNDGLGGPGFTFDNELRAPLLFNGRGQLAMANSNGTSGYAGSNGSQFFVTTGPLRFLDFNHTIFGQLVRGFTVLDKIAAVPVTGSKPTVDVVMTTVGLVQDDTDCMLIVSATGAGSSGVTVTARDADGLESSKAFAVDAVDDSVNDPPFLKQTPDVVAPPHQVAHVPISAHDLEFDYLIYYQSSGPQTGFLSNPTGAGFGINGNLITVTPNPSNPVGPVVVATSVGQLGPVLRSDAFDHGTVHVGLGDGRLAPVNATLRAAPGNPLANGTVGRFGDADPLATPASFTATINWGDGTPVTTGSNVTFSRVTNPAPSGFAIAASPHTYAKSGIYMLTIKVTDSLGATATIENTVVVTGGSVVATGRSLTAGSGLVADRLIASFSDTSATGSRLDYTARIDWGDGSASDGIIRTRGSELGVYGSHKYHDNIVAAVDVTVKKISTPQTANAWSTIRPLHLLTQEVPPFAQAHLIGEISSVSRNTSMTQPDTFLNATIFVINSGNKKSSPVQLKFYLSGDDTLSKATDTPLLVGLANTISFAPLAPGGHLGGTISNVRVFGHTTKDKYLIMEMLYTDPIGDHLPYLRWVASAKLTE